MKPFGFGCIGGAGAILAFSELGAVVLAGYFLLAASVVLFIDYLLKKYF